MSSIGLSFFSFFEALPWYQLSLIWIFLRHSFSLPLVRPWSWPRSPPQIPGRNVLSARFSGCYRDVIALQRTRSRGPLSMPVNSIEHAFQLPNFVRSANSFFPNSCRDAIIGRCCNTTISSREIRSANFELLVLSLYYSFSLANALARYSKAKFQISRASW